MRLTCSSSDTPMGGGGTLMIIPEAFETSIASSSSVGEGVVSVDLESYDLKRYDSDLDPHSKGPQL